MEEDFRGYYFPPLANFLVALLASFATSFGFYVYGLSLACLLVGHEIIFRRRFLLSACLIFTVLLGVAYGRFRLPEPLPREVLWCETESILRLQKVTVRQRKKHRQVFGFAEVESVGSARLAAGGQSIYFALVLPDKLPTPVRGQYLSVRGVIRDTRRGRSDFEHYLARTGTLYILQRGFVRSVRPGDFSYELLGWLRRRSEAALQRGLGGDSQLGYVYSAMLLGNRSGLSAEEKKAFSRTGTAHLFAVSGLHIGIIGVLLSYLLRGFSGRYRGLVVLVNLFVLFTFVQIVGGTPSALRAFFMVACFWLGPLFWRRATALSSLVLAAILTLLWNPLQLMDTGFQLSYSVVFSILLYGVSLGRFLRYRFFPQPKIGENRNRLQRFLFALGRLLSELFAMSLSASLPLIPLSIYHFNVFSIGGIFLNPFIMGLASCVVALGFLSIVLAFLPLFTPLLNRLALFLLWWVHGFVHIFSDQSWIESRPAVLPFPFFFFWMAAFFWSLYLSRRSFSRLFQLILPPAVAVFPLVPLYIPFFAK